MSDTKPVAAIRVWLDPPNLMIGYSRYGIEIATLALRTEAAKAAVIGGEDLLATWSAAGEADPGRAAALNELFDAIREVLGGGSGQVLPLNESVSALDALFEKVS